MEVMHLHHLPLGLLLINDSLIVLSLKILEQLLFLPIESLIHLYVSILFNLDNLLHYLVDLLNFANLIFSHLGLCDPLLFESFPC